MLTAIYVAFTGWETVAFTFEEHKRPELIPRIFAASYAIVVALYALLLLGLFAVVEPGEDGVGSTPLLLLAERSLGPAGRPVTVLLVVAAITANVVASVLALSRLVFGLSRSGALPAALGRVRERDRNPVPAVVAVGAVLTSIALLAAGGPVRLEVLFILSGGIYFVLYGLGAASYGRLAPGAGARVLTGLCGVTVLAVTVLAGPPLWWCWVAFAVLWAGTAWRGRPA
jgi:amino acid efflux transporter